MIKLALLLKNDYKLFIKSIVIKPNIIIMNLKNFDNINIISKFFKNLSLLKFKSLIEIVGIDYPFRKNRFELIYIFRSFNYNYKLFLKCFVRDRQALPSLLNQFESACWLEREVWDMFGVIFLNNFNLRRILTDYGFKGHPFRKDFPLTGFVEIRYDDSKQIILSEPIELSQEFRFFDFQSPWISKVIY